MAKSFSDYHVFANVYCSPKHLAWVRVDGWVGPSLILCFLLPFLFCFLALQGSIQLTCGLKHRNTTQMVPKPTILTTKYEKVSGEGYGPLPMPHPQCLTTTPLPRALRSLDSVLF